MQKVTGAGLSILQAMECAGRPLTAWSLIGPDLPKGTVYVTMQRLEAKRLVASDAPKNPRRPGRPLRFYSLTDEGRAALAAAAAADAAWERHMGEPGGERLAADG